MNLADFAVDRGSTRMSPGERRAVRWFGVAVMVLTTLPYLLCYSAEGGRQVFSGFVFGVDDGNSYIAKMLSGWAGSWLFRTPYTAYPQNGLVMFMPYILLGKLASPPGLHAQLTVLFHLFRIAAGMLMIFSSYDFISYFVHDRRVRMLGLALTALGGGLGWLLLLTGETGWLGSLPLDFISPEAFGFLSLYGLPHLSASRALMLWGLLGYLELVAASQSAAEQGTEKAKAGWGAAGKLGGLWLLAGFFNPIALVVPVVVIFVHLLGMWVNSWRRKVPFLDLKTLAPWLAAAAFLPLVSLLYNLAIAAWDPFASQWTSQNLLPSPHPLHYLLAYGLLVPFAIAGARQLLSRNFTAGWLLAGWVLVFPLLVYAPFGIQRRLVDGVWVALAILATACFDRVEKAGESSMKKRSRWLYAPLGLAFVSSAVLIMGGLLASRRPGEPVFLPAEQAAVFLELQDKSESRTVVLTSFETGNALPAYAPVRVLGGHGPESIRQFELRPEIVRFFQSDTSDVFRMELIERFNIRYIFWGPFERLLGDWQPAAAGYLKEIARQGDYALYQVIRGQP